MTKQTKAPVAKQTDVKPIFPLSRLHDEIDHLFRSFQSDFKFPEFFGDGREDFFRPSVDAHETENELQITIELPGVDEKDISVEAQDGTLTISGEKKSDSEVKEEAYYRQERTYGSFSRSMSLPVGVDEEKIAADFSDGVLKITVPKPAKSERKPKKVPLKKR